MSLKYHNLCLLGGFVAIRRSDHEIVSFNRTPQLDVSLVLAGKRHNPGEQGRIIRRSPHYLLHYITAGVGSVCELVDGVGRPSQCLSSGDWFLIRPGMTVQYQQDKNDPWGYQWFAVRGATVESCLTSWGFSDHSLVMAESDRDVIEPLLNALVEVMIGDSPSRFLMGTAYAQQLFATQWELKQASGAGHSRETVGIEERIDQACSFMQQHFDQGISVADVAEYVGFERSYFSKQFSRLVGTTVKRYLSDVRLVQAKAMLRDTALSVETIAAMVGFEHSRVFWRFFKAATGETPSRWRKAAVAEIAHLPD